MRGRTPRASVVVATYNRAGRLAACLAALASQSAQADDFEVVVVVDGSTDGTGSLLANFPTPYRLRCIEQQNQGQCTALNHGAAEAAGELLVFLDDDMIASPGLVSAHLSLFERDPSAVGVGQMLLQPAPGSDWFAQAFAESWHNHYERLNAAPTSLTWRDCFGGNMSAGRERFLRAGGFATDLSRGYDLELALRLAADGCHFIYLPQAAAVQDERKDHRALIRDSELGGLGAAAIYRRYPQALSLIGHFPEQTPQAAILLRAMLRLNLPPALLARVLWWAPQILGRQKLFFDLLHRYAFWRGVRYGLADMDAWEQVTHGVVILMYHGFCRAGERVSRYLVHPARFDTQMRWLKRRGYNVLDLESYASLRRAEALPPPRSVLITFDDGYAELNHVVRPVLRSMSFPAAVFLPTRKVGQVNDWDPGSELYGRRLLSWHEVRSLRGSGISFGAHSRTHPSLAALGPEELREEIEGPQSDLERELGERATSFSYPYGEFQPEFSRRLAEAGYVAGLSVDPGPNTPLTDIYALRRVEIWGQDSLLAFAYALGTGRELRAAFRRTSLVLRETTRRVTRGIGYVEKFRRTGKTLAAEKN